MALRAIKAGRYERKAELAQSPRGDNRIQTRAQTAEDPKQTGAAALQRLMWAKRPPQQDIYRRVFGRSLDLNLIEQALRASWLGNMRLVTDLSRETLDTDPHLAAVIGKRVGIISASKIRVAEAQGDGIDAAKAKFYASVVRDQIAQVPAMSNKLQQLAFAHYDGRACLENQWRFVAGPKTQFGTVNWVIGDMGWIHPRRLSFGPDREIRIVDQPFVNTLFAPVGIDTRDYPGKFVTFTPQLFGDYPEREGLAPRCLYWSFFKRFAARERMILVELFGKPWRWVSFKDESDISDEAVDQALDFAENIAGSNWGGLPRGADFNVEQLDSNTGEAHEKIIESSDKQLSKLVLGQTGTTDAQPMGLGSTQSKVMSNEQIMIHTSDANRMGDVLEDSVGDPIIALNFGVQELNHAPNIFIDLPIKNEVADLERLNKALSSGLSVSLSEAYEISGFRTPEPDEAVIRMDQPPPVPGALAAPPPRPVVVYPPDQPPEEHVQEPAAKVQGDDESEGGLPGAPLAPAPNAPSTPPKAPAPGQEPKTGPPGSPTTPAPESGAKPPPSPGGSPGEQSGNPSVNIPMPPGAAVRSVASLPGETIELMIRHEDGKYTVYSHDGKKPLGTYDTLKEAQDRLAQIERAKHAKAIIDQGVVWPTFTAALGGSHTAAGILIDAVHADARWVHPEAEHGSSVWLARQPDSVYGSPESLIEKGVREGARFTRKMAEQLTERVPDHATVTAGEIFRSLGEASRELVDVAPFARALERRMLHSMMLGCLDSHYERTENVTIDLPTFAALRGMADLLLEGDDEAEIVEGLEGANALAPVPAAPKFAAQPLDAAARFFKSKAILPKATFERLSVGAKRRAFTIAGVENEQLLRLAHAELASMIAKGAALKDFKKMMAERVESAGWTPSNRSHIETIFRTNVTQAHSVGRIKDMTQPAVLRDRPYWMSRGVGDARQRLNHGAIDGWVIPASDPFWDRAFPGNYGFNCRCRATSLSQKQVTARGYRVHSGAEVIGLPDVGFTGSGMKSMLANFD